MQVEEKKKWVNLPNDLAVILGGDWRIDVSKKYRLIYEDGVFSISEFYDSAEKKQVSVSHAIFCNPDDLDKQAKILLALSHFMRFYDAKINDLELVKRMENHAYIVAKDAKLYFRKILNAFREAQKSLEDL